MNDGKPQPVDLLQRFALRGDELCIGGIPVSLLAERVGSTPFYAYDRALISQRIAELRAALPAEVHLHYAMKANPMPAVVQHVAARVDGLDVASAGELLVALDTGIDPGTISFAGPAKTAAEIRRAVAAGVVINAESVREIDAALEAGRALGVRPKIAIRVNPTFELRGAGMKMGGSAKQFGIDAEAVPAIIRDLDPQAVEFAGLHIFTGSQCLRAE
ncbi:MAG: hypothetical protein NZM12_09315, partial [Steroidobacteraceae bacterium]|nr:hypothetical protein [Steroidobacteraceae bacterium]MDW8259116.1 pyridoxal-dependent decarboxylase, exosortase A system-associated [Gammaproteobacteria bacterium]